MSLIKRKAKQSSLIHQKIRKASFVPLESRNSEKFKYNVKLKYSKYINKKFIALKTFCNKIIQKPGLLIQKVDVKAIKQDALMWVMEAAVEGFIVNFAVWGIIGWKFNLITMLAWGFAVKQLLSIYRRLKKYGSASTIPHKNK